MTSAEEIRYGVRDGRVCCCARWFLSGRFSMQGIGGEGDGRWFGVLGRECEVVRERNERNKSKREFSPTVNHGTLTTFSLKPGALSLPSQ